jgi:hypothetical protein
VPRKEFGLVVNSSLLSSQEIDQSANKQSTVINARLRAI